MGEPGAIDVGALALAHAPGLHRLAVLELALLEAVPLEEIGGLPRVANQEIRPLAAVSVGELLPLEELLGRIELAGGALSLELVDRRRRLEGGGLELLELALLLGGGYRFR